MVLLKYMHSGLFFICSNSYAGMLEEIGMNFIKNLVICPVYWFITNILIKWESSKALIQTAFKTCSHECSAKPANSPFFISAAHICPSSCTKKTQYHYDHI